MVDMEKAEPSTSDIPIVCDYLDVFSEEFPVLPPKREIGFAIHVVPSAAPTSITSYRMALMELKELKLRLQELLEKGFHRVYHHGELQCSLLRRKTVHFGCVLIIDNFTK